MNIADWFERNGEALQLALFFGFFFALTLLEYRLPRRQAQAFKRRRWRTNLGLTLLNLGVLSSLPVSFIVAAYWAQSAGWGLLHLREFPAGLLVLATLLLRAFISWLTHLLNHKLPLLWRLHRVHHLDNELDVSTTVRLHPLEFVFNLLIGLPLVAAFGLTPWVLIFYEALDAMVTVFSHSNIRLPQRVDRGLKYLIVTPDLHRVHHSSWQPETDSNYGAVFPIWDLLFRTFRSSPRQAHETMQLGLNDVRGPNNRRLLWLLLSPFRRELADHSGKSGDFGDSAPPGMTLN